MRKLSSERIYDCDAVDALFFCSFVAIVCIIGFNIVVAVLLEGFLQSMVQESELEAIEEESRDNHRAAGALDPLLATLSNCWSSALAAADFSCFCSSLDYEGCAPNLAVQSPQHLMSQLDLLFALWDVDDNGTVDFNEMNDGLRTLGYEQLYA